MSVSPWFDYNVYMANKVTQLKATDPAGNWTIDKVAQAFADLGYAGTEGAERHFVDFGQNEDVAPNAFFNPTEYYRAKAAHAYGKDYKAVTDADAALVKAAIKGLGMNAWSHYDTFGSSEKVNPSNQFDTEAYMKAKLDALNAVDGGQKYELADVYAAFKAAGINALEHFMTFGGNKQPGEVALKYEGTIPAEFAVPENKKVNGGGGSGERFTLTSAIDTIIGTAGDDTIIGDNSGAVDSIQRADSIDGGSGKDTLILYGNGGILPEFKSIEALELHAVGANDVNIASKVGVEKLLVEGIDATATQTIKTAAGVSFTLKNVVDNSSAIVFDTPDATVNLTLSDVTATGAGLDFGTADNKANTTLNLTAVGKNNVELINTGGSLTSVNVAGDGKLTFDAVASVTTINAAENSGGVTFNAIANSLKFTGGKGNDVLVFGTAADFDVTDVIDMGAGTEDTIKINAATATSSLLKKVAGLDILDLNGGGAGTGYSVNASDFTTFHTFKFSAAATGAVGVSNASPTNGKAGVEVTGLASDGTDTIILDASAFTGGDGVAASSASQGADGGAGVKLTLKSVAADNLVNLVIGEEGLATVTLTGGTGASGTGPAKAGVGLDASGIDELHINLLSNLDINIGGTPTGTTTNTLVATRASITLTGKGDADLGVVSDSATAAASAALNIDASKLNGKLTVTTGDGNDTILAGSKGSDITGGKGADNITLGAGKDLVQLVAGDSGIVNGTGIDGIDVITGFTGGVNGDVLDLGAGGASKYVKLSDAALASVAGITGLKAAADEALRLAAQTSKWTAFTHGDKTYAVYDTDASFDSTAGVIVELSGVKVGDLTDANFLA